MIQYPAMINPTPTEVRTITSTYVQQEYQLFISLPASYATSDKTFPVLYLLDGNATYPLVRPVIEILQIIQQIPDLIVVGIGYPAATYMDTAALRGRDLTPVELTPEQKAGDAYPFEETGGASRFLSFLTHELIPYIDQNFRTDPNDRALLGWSLGGASVLYTLFEQPNLFQRLIAVSPSIDMLDTEKRSLKEKPPLPVKLYWAIEAPSDDPQTRKEVELHRQLMKDICEPNHEGLEIDLKIYEGEDHFTVGPIGFVHGLREVYR
jgi:predicted alpha/beta superfamily hydrolase